VTARVHTAAALLAALVVAVATACGGGDGDGSDAAAGGEGGDEWAALLSDLGFDGETQDVEVSGELDGSELVLQIEVDDDAPGEVTFGDGLYGAQAYTFVDGAWERIDTADARTLNAPVLAPGESAEVRLPVEDAESYRVLVPVETAVVWTDIS
jgi:hypothetical protein